MSWRHRAVAGLVVLLVVAGLAGDRWVRERQADALLDRVVAVEQVVRASQASLSSLTAYQSALLVRADIPPEARASAYGVLADDAARWGPRLAVARDAVAGSSVLPWHDRAHDVREAWTARADSWAELLDRLEQTPERGLSGQAEATRLRELARQSLVALAPGDARVRELTG